MARSYAARLLSAPGAGVGQRGEQRLDLVAHRLEGAEKHRAIMEGVVLARGGAARRAETEVAIDPEAGGAKLARQAKTVGWPICFTADRLDSSALEEALDYCLTEEARALARECADRARLLIGSLAADVRREIAAVE